MGQLITTVVGGALGFLVGGPLGAQIGATLGGMIGASLFGPTIKGPRLNDLKVSASTYGAAIPEIYGTVRIGSNMIWTTGIKETKHKSGGKGGPKQETYSYDCTFAVALCKGPIDDILRIWADGKLIYDVAGGSTRLPGFSGNDSVALAVLKLLGQKKKKKGINIRVYRGTEDQMPDSLIVADKGTGNVSAHRGIAYIVFENMPLEDYGNRVPQLTFEVTKNISNNMPNLKAEVSESEPIPNVTSRTWIPDWELGRLYGLSGTSGTYGTVALDLTTMQVSYQMDRGLFLGYRQTYIPGLGYYLRTPALSNSDVIEVWDFKTMAQIETIGTAGNTLGGAFLNGCGEKIERYGNLGAIGHCFCTTGSQRVLHLLVMDWTRSVWAFKFGNPIPLFNATSDFNPAFCFPGKQNTLESEFVAWRNASNRLELEVWHIAASANASLNSKLPPGGCGGPSYTWEQSTDFQKSRYNIQPFSEPYTAHLVLYDPTDDCVFSAGLSNNVPCVFKFSFATGTYKFKIKNADYPLPYQNMRFSRLSGGTMGYGGSYGGATGTFRWWVEIDLQNGAMVRKDLIDEAEFESQFGFGSNQQWDDDTSSLIVNTRTNFRRVYFRSGADKLSVAAVVSDICERTNILSIGDIDVSELEDSELVGYTIDRETTARDVLKQLATAFLFDGYESDYKLKFRSRGNDSIVTIPESWIARDSENIVVRETITQELELPMRVTVNYYDTTRDHQQGSQTMKRNAAPYPSMWTRKEDIVELPISWTPDDAKQCADKLLKMSWANRYGYNFTLPWKYMKYDPTDVVTINLEDGTVLEARLSDVTIGADFQIQASGASEKAAAYVSTAVGQIGEAPGQGIPNDYPSYPIVANTPLLRDVDYDTSGNSTTYVAAGTYALTYSGAQIFINDGFQYEPIGATEIEAVTGICLTTLPYTTATESTDETFVLRVRLDDASATLESITQEEMLTNYQNAALVGNEIIQFRDAVLNVDGTWSLTGILRARRGTNYAVRDHVASEQFLLLDIATMAKFARPPEDYNITRDFKAVTTGGLVEDAIAYPFTLLPRDLMPYSPEDVEVSDDGTDVTVSMARRSRVTAPLKDGTGIIHYKEGEKTAARINYQMWLGLTIADTTTVASPDFDGNIPLFDASGIDLPNEFTFPLSNLGSETKFLLRLAEIGVVEGIPKWVECERIGEDLWNITELY